MGIVYFVRSGLDGPIKIGRTTCGAGTRVSSLQTGNPERLHIVATMPGGAGTESALHIRFKHLSIHGEWFRPEPEILTFIEGVRFSQDEMPRLDMTDEPTLYGLTLEQLNAIKGFIAADRKMEAIGGVSYVSAKYDEDPGWARQQLHEMYRAHTELSLSSSFDGPVKDGYLFYSDNSDLPWLEKELEDLFNRAEADFNSKRSA